MVVYGLLNNLKLFCFVDCTKNDSRPSVFMNLRSERERDCRYRLTLEWSVEYNIDFLEALHSFRTVVTTENKRFTKLIQESSVIAHNAVCYITSTYIFNNFSHLEQPY